MTPIRHGVDATELANPLWHHLFGFMSEYLIEREVIAAPETIPGEGRYLKALYIDSGGSASEHDPAAVR